METKIVPFLEHLRNEIRELQRKVVKNRDGRSIELTETTYDDGRTIYKVFDRDGENFDPVSTLDQKTGFGWPKPVIVNIMGGDKRDGLSYRLSDNAIYRFGRNIFACALTKKIADRKMYERAKKIATVIAERTGLPLVERTTRYQGIVCIGKKRKNGLRMWDK